MARNLRLRPPIGKNEVTDQTGNMARRGFFIKPGNIPVKTKRQKVESVIRITRSRELPIAEPSPAQPPPPLSVEQNHAVQAHSELRRTIQARYSHPMLVVTGIPSERRLRVDQKPIDVYSNKHEIEEVQEPPRKRRKVDWVARVVRSPRRSLRITQQDSTSSEPNADGHASALHNLEDEIPLEDRSRKDSAVEKLPETLHLISALSKRVDLNATILGSITDPFKSPATDVTDCYFDAVAEQSGERSPELLRKINSEQSGEQIYEQASEKLSIKDDAQLSKHDPENIVEQDDPVDMEEISSGLTESIPIEYEKQSSSSFDSSVSGTRSLPSSVSDHLLIPDLSSTPHATAPPTLTFTSSDKPPLVPYLSIPDPLPPRSMFGDNEAYTLATKFPPLLPLPVFITALTLQPLSDRSTAELYELAMSTQQALQEWQDEYVLLDKKTAPVAGPFPKKPATGGRQPIDMTKWEEDKEKELFGEGTLLAPLVKRRGLAANKGKGANSNITIQEGRELRKRKGDASFIEALGISEDDAGALTEGRRTRRSVRRFEIEQQNGEARRSIRRGRGGLNTTIGGSTVDASVRNGYDSDTIPQSVDSDTNLSHYHDHHPARRPKKSRLGALQTSFNNDSNDTTPSPTPDPADGDFSDANANARRRKISSTNLLRAATHLGTEAVDPKKQRKKSEKRSESMTAWWAERKKNVKAAAAAAAAIKEKAMTNSRVSNAAGPSTASETKRPKAQAENGKEKRGNRRETWNTSADHLAPRTGDRNAAADKVFGPGGLDARGGVMETWAADHPRPRIHLTLAGTNRSKGKV